jgi:hypothetical protein
MARSGIMPKYRKVRLPSRYVLIATASHISGERRLGHSSREFG